jgi:serine/threonine-protein kinase
MGEVYRARDTKLNRDVAIKILPNLFAADRDRVARFEREAQTLASLNHPHIAQIYGSVDLPPEAGSLGLVMEFVDGEDLSRRIARSPIPIDDAMAIARQIAEALEAAHERGIVHRDLKPANIKLRADGAVKVLDFGLAKAMTPDLAQALGPVNAANSPTFTSPALTNLGLILGTAAYMAPEQAKGKAVDRRADLWAFGVIFFEMLTGRAAFSGESVTEVLAAVVTRDPAWTQLPAATPPGIRRLLARCLTRDPHNRLADAGEARHQIDEALSAPANIDAVGAARRSRTGPSPAALAPWIVAVALAGLTAWLAWDRSRVNDPSLLRYSVEAPPKTTVNVVSRPAIALSSNGKMLAYVGTTAGTSRLYLRSQSEFESHAVPGTEGASEPVFSPDGRWLAFVVGAKLCKMPVAGGSVEVLADVNDPRGLSWDVPEVITYTPQAVSGVFEIAPSPGAVPTRVTTPVAGVERSHRWAQRMPNGSTLFTVGVMSSPDNYDDATIEAVDKTGARRVLVRGASMARYVPPGFLVFVRAAKLYAVGFNPDTLQVIGAPVAAGATIAGDSTTGASSFAFAAGTFAYVPGTSADILSRLVWRDRTGRAEPVDLVPGSYFDVAMSPDGRRAAVVSVGNGGTDIWVYDFGRKTFTRLTFGGSHRTPVWSHDGTYVYYVALAPDGSSNSIVRKVSDGSREEEVLLTLKLNAFLRDVSEDGHLLLIDHNVNGSSKSEISTVAVQKDAKPVPLIATQFDDYVAKWSPDRRWVAYQSNESGRMEVYVREATGQGGRWQISTLGGEEPRWSVDGRELYYRADTQMMVAAIEPGSTFRNGSPQLLFDGLYNLRSESNVSYDIDQKSGRFLTIRVAEDAAQMTTIRLALDWTSQLARLIRAQ